MSNNHKEKSVICSKRCRWRQIFDAKVKTTVYKAYTVVDLCKSKNRNCDTCVSEELNLDYGHG